MAAHIPPNYIVKSNDIRYLKLYRDYILIVIHHPEQIEYSNNVEHLRLMINKAISSYSNTPELRAHEIEEMHAICSGQYVNDSYTSWINDTRACAWLWLNIISNDICNHRTLSKLEENNNVDTSKVIFRNYTDLELKDNPIPLHHNDRLNIIKEYFDRYCFDTSVKFKIINIINEDWNNREDIRTINNWLIKEDAIQCEWVWDHFNEKIIQKQDDLPSIVKQTILAINSPEEMYAMFFGFYLSWREASSVKELFFLKMKNTWAQKKSRLKKTNNNLKDINVSVKLDIRNQLDELADNYNLTITKTVELAIKNEYERFKKHS